MLKHSTENSKPKRVVVIGAGGFVGGALVARIHAEGVPCLPLARADIDLLADNASSSLKSLLQPGDAVVAAAAIAPCKNVAMLRDNLAMVDHITAAIEDAPVDHVINISSDAVYTDLSTPLTEDSPAAPTSLHGVMHLARELVFQERCKAPLCMLRPTLIYGAKDPHNGYGPNKFRRLADAGEEIVLFGEGEERRDHVLIDDVVDIIWRCLSMRSEGALNIATGTVVSFRDIADMVVSNYDAKVAVKGTPRNGPMPHNGYRAFDVAATMQAFTGFQYTQPKDGIRYVHEVSRG